MDQSRWLKKDFMRECKEDPRTASLTEKEHDDQLDTNTDHSKLCIGGLQHQNFYSELTKSSRAD